MRSGGVRLDDRRRRRRRDHRPARGPQRHRLRDDRRARRRARRRRSSRTPRCSCCAAAATARSSRAATSRSSARSARTRTRSRMASRVRRLLDRVAAFPVPVDRGAERARARRRSRGRDRGRHPHRGRRREDRLQPGDARHHARVGRRGAARAGDRAGAARSWRSRPASSTTPPTAQRLGLVDVVVPRATFDDEWRALARSAWPASAPGTTRAVKAVIGAAAPSCHPELEADATDAFAQLWTADAHWAAVDALEQKRRTG